MPPPKRPEEDETALMALLELLGAEKLAMPGLERSTRPLGRGNAGDPKLRPGEAALKLRTGAGDGAVRKAGRDSVRGEEMLGVRGGLAKSEFPRKVEGRVT
jgi:hypothetical protein